MNCTIASRQKNTAFDRWSNNAKPLLTKSAREVDSTVKPPRDKLLKYDTSMLSLVKWHNVQISLFF